MANEWGPLAALAGEWVGEAGEDRAFSHSLGEVHDTPYREVCTMKPFGPVDNGSQSLYGLDYKTAMWRDDEENPFHTEVGYWLWDAATGEVMKGFVVPRGVTVLAGGIAAPNAKTFTMHASIQDPCYAIGENQYLAAHASSRSYEVVITIDDAGWSYSQTTTLQMNEFAEPFAHTDHHTLRRAE
ncbi:MAG: heme-binding beta-barrel domain-containing protein [Actinomycetes bacterium]